MRVLKDRTWLITILASLVLLAGTAYWGYSQFKAKNQVLTHLNNRNQKSFLELVGHVENIEVLLGKTAVSASLNNRSVLLADLWQQAYFAQEDLSALPISQNQRGRTNRFLTQMGDFAFTLAKKQAFKRKITDEEFKKLVELHKEAGDLSTELQKIRARAADGALTWDEVKRQGAEVKKAGMNTYNDGFFNIETKMQQYPTLIYDGPFSDHVEQRSPKGLTGTKITATEAKRIAKEFLEAGNKPEFRVDDKVRKIEGKISAYRVRFRPALENAGPTAIVDISRKGGHVIMMVVNRDSGGKVISLKQAEDTAARYLNNRGFNNMEPTYSLVQGNSAIISYAYQQNGIRIYPDLIKVKVALDNGDIIGFEALGYFMSHHKRDISNPKITRAEARKKVSPNLEIKESRMAVIPTEALKEKLAYEFKGEINGETFVVYIDAMTGDEEKILKIVDTKDGPMTM